MSSVFSKIISGEIPSFKIAEDDNYIAFLDVFPLVIGHTLVVPKKEIDFIFDLGDSEFSGLHLFSKRIAKAIQRSVECKKVGVAVVGLEVPHAHIHLIPMNKVSDMDFSKSKLKPEAKELSAMASLIRSKLF